MDVRRGPGAIDRAKRLRTSFCHDPLDGGSFGEPSVASGPWTAGSLDAPDRPRSVSTILFLWVTASGVQPVALVRPRLVD